MRPGESFRGSRTGLPARCGPGGPDPGRDHRRGRGARPPVRAAADHLRRLHRVGRPLDFIEDAIGEQVLPRYANTHTKSSGPGLATSRLREDARQIIHDAAGGTAGHL